MGLIFNIKAAMRSTSRRKTKHASAILAITLGVSLLVGIQITTATLKNSFVTSLSLNQGEVDLKITNSTGLYLNNSGMAGVEKYVPEAKGLMLELSTVKPILLGSQFEPQTKISGIQLNYSKAFGYYYDWVTGEQLEIETLLADSNNIVLLASELAEDLGLSKEDLNFPLTLATEFFNASMTVTINHTTGQPIYSINYEVMKINLSVVKIFDSKRPGIGAYMHDSVVMSLDNLQRYLSYQDPLKKTDFVDSYLISLKTNHFEKDIDQEYLQSVFDAVKERLPTSLTLSSSRLTFLNSINSIFNLMTAFFTALGVLIITTGLLLITNVQLMSVEDREFQTGVLRAVGENRLGIFRSYLIETVFQGIVGGIFGLIGGVLFGWIIASYLSSIFGTGQGSVLPVIESKNILLSLISGVVLAIITGIFPSIRASRVNVVEALRGIKVKFEEKSSRNYILLGILISIFGIINLLQNGIIEGTQSILVQEGWDSLEEWIHILIGFGFLFSGLGITLSYFVDRFKAMNMTALSLWGLPCFTFLVGLDWIDNSSGSGSTEILIIGIIELIIGSVLLVGMNLPIIMRSLRSLLIRIRSLKGVAEISPALISSHKTRSTLTFAIFAIILTLNVTVATLVATNFSGSIGKAEEDSRGVDLFVTLSKPETILNDTSYSQELRKLDPRISDVIPFKTSDYFNGRTNLVALSDPYSPSFNVLTDVLPMRFIEFGRDQIQGNATSYLDSNWRYDPFLKSFPDAVKDEYKSGLSENELLTLSRKSWEAFLDPNYKMSAYNRSGFAFGSFGAGGHGDVAVVPDDTEPLRDENSTLIKNPVIFTDSFFLPLGSQVWVPMNTSVHGVSYQRFTVAGILDYRSGGFPLRPSRFGLQGSFSGGGLVGSIIMPEHWSNQTNYFGEADGQTPYSRKPNQYDAFFIKTSLTINSPEIDSIAQSIETYTNTKDSGYRALIDD
ncbi:MAG: ABC transporter permease, partial [Candidatus Hodarchaeales archaeon]